ncbi:MAG: hypothetical protein ACJA01_004241 [Saprospiraceae bacterium]|jgi:hypothetical protein
MGGLNSHFIFRIITSHDYTQKGECDNFLKKGTHIVILIGTNRVGETSDAFTSVVSSSHTTQRTPHVLGGFINFEQE